MNSKNLREKRPSTARGVKKEVRIEDTASFSSKRNKESVLTSA